MKKRVLAGVMAAAVGFSAVTAGDMPVAVAQESELTPEQEEMLEQSSEPFFDLSSEASSAMSSVIPEPIQQVLALIVFVPLVVGTFGLMSSQAMNCSILNTVGCYPQG